MLDALNEYAKASIATIVGTAMAIMIASESSSMMRSPSPTGPAGESTAVWHAASEIITTGSTLRSMAVPPSLMPLSSGIVVPGSPPYVPRERLLVGRAGPVASVAQST